VVAEGRKPNAAFEPGQCRVHETDIKTICDDLLQDGRRVSPRRVSSIDTAFVDDLLDVDGEKIERRVPPSTTP
jgi:hypothetical protein